MRVKLASLGLALFILLVSVSVAFADNPTQGPTPRGKGVKTPQGQLKKTPEARGTPEKKGDKRNGIFGTVASKGADSFTVTTKQRPVTITVTASTRFQFPKKRNGSFADLAVGDRVAVNGTPSAGGLVAKKVMVVPGKPTTLHRVGEVTAYTAGSSITIKTVKGESETFALTAQTTVKNPKGTGVKVGDQVTIVSRRDPSSDQATATGIVVHPKEDK